MKKTTLATAALTFSLTLSQVAFADLVVRVHGSTPSASTRSSGDSEDDEQATSKKNNNRDEADSDDENNDDPPIEAVNRYGSQGDTTSQQQRHRGRYGVIDTTMTDETGTTTIEGETVTGEYRSRNYTEDGFLRRKVGTQHQASLVRSRYGTSYDSPAANVGDVEVLRYHSESEVEAFVGAQADAEAGFDLASTDPRAEVKVGVFVGARVDASSSQQVDVLGASASTTAEGSASVGAEAAAEGSLSKNGAEAKVGAFAGARAKGSVGGEVGGVGAKGTGEAWAGVGAEADATTKFEDGKLTLGTEAGAGLGVGGKVGYETTLDVNKVHKDGTALVDNGTKLVTQLDKPVTVHMPKVMIDSRRASGANIATRLAAETTQRSLRQTQPSLPKPRQLSRDVRNTTQKSADTISRVNNDAGKSVSNARKSAADTSRKITDSVKKPADKVGTTAKSKARKVGSSVKRLFK